MRIPESHIGALSNIPLRMKLGMTANPTSLVLLVLLYVFTDCIGVGVPTSGGIIANSLFAVTC